MGHEPDHFFLLCVFYDVDDDDDGGADDDDVDDVDDNNDFVRFIPDNNIICMLLYSYSFEPS
jgi:hypothetical protein